MKEFGGKSEVNEVSASQQMERPQMSPEVREKYERITGLDKIPKNENKDKEMSAPEGERPIDVAKKEELPKPDSELQRKYEELSGLSDLKAYLDKSSENNGQEEDVAETKTEKMDYSKYLDKGEDGKWYDKETGKAYDSVDDWIKAQETLAKRYEGTADYYQKKADKAWARYKNAEANGDSADKKSQNYLESQKCYAKAKECSEKAAAIREKIKQEQNSKEVYDDNGEKDTSESEKNNKEKDNKETDKANEQKDVDDSQPIKNKQDGLAREKEVEEELKGKYPESEGYEILSEVYLRDKDGNIVRDPETGEARRIDFVVVKDGKVVDSVEVTSKTADKAEQSSKEARIREAGGNYVRDDNGNLVEIPANVTTRIERRD